MQPSTLAKLLPVAATCGLIATTAQAQTTLRADRIITGVSSLSWVGSPPTDDRIFLTEQSTGDVEVYTNEGAFLGKALDLTGTINTGSERGLLSLAFDPDFGTNGYVYVYYTNTAVGSRIERYTMLGDPLTSNVIDASSGLTIIQQVQPQSNHNGGHIEFGQDGYLYFAWGDGGGAGDSACNAQKGTTLLGKMIRIDVDTDAFPADPTRNYGIPADNPFVGDPTMLDEVYHLGLRNPWRWHFDPLNDDMYIGDVGQDAREEISWSAGGVSGLNFGWKIMEGNNCFSTSGCPVGIPPCNSPLLTDPIHEYNHTGGFGGPCTVIGGVVYRGCAIPEEYGTYFFAEHCDNNIWTFSYDSVSGVQNFQDRTSEITASFSIASIRSFGYDHSGEVLIGDSNEVFRIVAETRSFTPDTCQISISAGGVQSWDLDAGAGFGGQLYFIGGSLTGTAGIPTGSVLVPLTLDSYTNYSLANPNVAPLINTFASLNGAGQASAEFNLAGGILPATIIGTRGYHAYAVLDASLAGAFASNAAAIEFLP
ncbi:MAG: PQQ-dependent sugar dehydrogenase [Planctomycetota bacterium]